MIDLLRRALRPLFLVLVVTLQVVGCLVGLAHAEEQPRTAAALLALPRHETDRDELDVDRTARMTEHGTAIDGTTADRLERGALVTLASREGVNLARFVDLDEPKCREGRAEWCDGGRAWSVYQLHGTDRTGDRAWAAREALSRWRFHGTRCARMGFDRVVGAFAGYATGGKACDTADARERAAEATRRAGAL
jgi:hypothetical protein